MTGGTAGTLYQDAELTVINEKINNSGNKVSYCYSNDLKKYCYVTSQYITFVEAEGETETGSIDKEKEPEEINYREKIVEIAMAEYKANGERKLAEPIKYNYGYMQKIKEAGSSAWCADFICWCAGQADVPMSVLPHEADLSSTKLTADGYSNYGRTYKGVSLASVRQLSKYLTEHCGAEYYALASKEIKNGSYIPQPGDLILYGHGEDYQHIGMVVEFDSVTKKVVTVEGNTTTKKDDTNGHVATKSRTYNKYDIGGGWYIQGYISPDYDK